MIIRNSIITALILLVSGCATIPPPVSENRYTEIEGAPSIGLKVVDARDDNIVGTVGLTSFKMNSLDSFLYSELRNELNTIGGLNVSTYTNLSDSGELRLPVILEATIKSVNFRSVDALLDDADGTCSVLIQIKNASGKLLFSDTFTSAYKRKVAWPNMNANKVIVDELLKRVAKTIILSPKVKTLLAY